MEKRYFYAIVLGLIMALAFVSPAAALTVSVAAPDSSSTSKTGANYLCSGTNDQTQITNALNAVSASGGGTVYLSEGTFKVQYLQIPGNVVLQGKGPATTKIIYTASGSVQLPASGSKLIGVAITGPAVVWVTAGRVTVQDVTVHGTGLLWAAFSVEKRTATASVGDIEFRNCQAIDCDTNGFSVSGADTSNVITNLRFINCRAVNCGKASPRYNQHVVGFDLAEAASVDGLLVDGCSASGSYESGFHFESRPVVRNAVLRNCVSENNGLSPTAQWGAGFTVGEGIIAENCRSINNQYGWFVHSAGFQASQCVDTGSDTSFIFARYLKGAQLTNCGSKNAKVTALTGLDQNGLRATNLVVENCLGSTPVLAPRATNSVIDWHYGSVSAIGTGTVIPTSTPAPTGSILFTSVPAGGKIYIDGVYKGVTPATIPGISTGIHRAEIRYTGYVTWIKSITVTSDFLTSTYSYNPTLVRA